MTLSDLSIRRPVFAIVLSLMLLVVGLVSLGRLWQTVREFPDINAPFGAAITIFASLPREKSKKTIQAEMPGRSSRVRVTDETRRRYWTGSAAP